MRKSRIIGACAAGLVFLAAPPVSAAPPNVWNQVTFNTASGGTEIVDHYERLIKGAKAGSSITVAMFRLWDEPITDALAEAALERDITVRVIVDDGNLNDGYDEHYQDLKKALEEAGDDSWAKECEGACHGTNAMHNKFMLFSEIVDATGEDAENVVATGSANLSMGSLGGTGGWNSVYTMAGQGGIYHEYVTYFAHLARDEADPNYYDDHLSPPLLEPKRYFYPRHRDKPDTAINSLKVVDCKAQKTTIRIGMWSISRKGLSEMLRKKAADGCRVDIVADRIANDDGDDSDGDEACVLLTKPGEGADRLTIRGFDEPEKDGIHDKNMMIEGHYLDTGTKVVWTGSHNFNYLSRWDNDENVIRILNQAIMYDAFVENFERIKKHTDFSVETRDECEKIAPKAATAEREVP